MEVRAFAEQVLYQANLTDKLRPAETPFTDAEPGLPVRVEFPARPPELAYVPDCQGPPMPGLPSFHMPTKRAIAHHIMANHELLALEVMAYTLLAFPQAPTEFRRGIAEVMGDEQRHTRMHIERAEMLGLTFGTHPVNFYFWLKARDFQSELDYIAGLPLTFEGGNLDHTLEFAAAFDVGGDPRSAALMRVIHRDEIEHVRFGWDWLLKLKPADQSAWDAYVTHLHWPLRPAKAKGKVFHRPPRELAGLTPEFIDQIEQAGQQPPH